MSGSSSFWLILPILAAIFYAVGSVVQNFCVDTAIPKRQAASYVFGHIVTFVFCILLMLGIFGRAVFMMPLMNAVGIMIAGVINVVGSAYYYKALQTGDTMDISIYGEVGPLISLGLGVAILGQSITPNQALAFLFIMGGALIIVFSDGAKKDSAKGPDFSTIGLTVIATFFSVLSDVIFCYFLDGTKDYTLFAQSFFYFSLGSLLAVVVGFICFENWRHALKKAFIKSKKRNSAWLAMLVDNVSFIMAEILYKLGLIIAPVLALLSVMGNVSRLIAGFFLALVLGKNFPKLAQAKKITKKMLYNYMMAGLLILVGVMIINS